ncbi:glycoside hydrolase family 76 protein [Acetobacter senegalensis]|uniref:glycoside hydrolase family 76 protein n=1 Tax=Acetobacter senegalensis TaxID=446692 RepID=UPI0020A10C81|nr:glycoside hydrolase family 76 protein [Acetobacter senegalensis]MCP1196481.1 glycoside hydrolase family 76 protein [Acetobacter senegalensis]
MRSGPFRVALATSFTFATGILIPLSLRASDEIVPSKTDLLQHAQAAFAVLPTQYSLTLHTHRNGGGFHAWQRFVTVSSLVEYESASGDGRFSSLARALLADRHGLDGNDDFLWVAEAALDMAAVMTDKLSQQHAIQDAETIFKQIATQYWDETCGGGVWWDHARTYKNAITNELFLDVAARLRNVTGSSDYKNWAERTWRWFSESGMISPSHAVNDGLNHHCHNNGGPPYSYNQGVVLDALLHLFAITGKKPLLDEATRIAEEALAAGTTQGNGFREAEVPMTVDSQIFRGIFVRALGHLVLALPPGPERAHLSSWLQDESRALWKNRFQQAHFNATWEKAPQQPSAQAQITAANLFVAAASLPNDATQ